ncbi:hypothetical protein EDD85DRAFT_867366 [Armillaria nabsnona]|nr:hypothetical protein EDD85DRAFT_867366 [Armillaria nabsnona]
MQSERSTTSFHSSKSDITWISSLASCIADNPVMIGALASLVVLGTIAYRFSPPLSPRTQLAQLKNLLDEVIDPDDKSGCGLPVYDPHYTHDSLKRIQINTCQLERRLLSVSVEKVSWGEYLCSLKEVYVQARACCNQIRAMKPFIEVSHL